jgi:DNA-binding NtrC family response regulator
VNNIEPAYVILCIEEDIYKGTAHIVHLVNKIRMGSKRTPVIVNTVDTFIPRLVMSAQAGKYMDFVTLPFKGACQFCYVIGNPPYAYRMVGLPRKKCYTHALIIPLP